MTATIREEEHEALLEEYGADHVVVGSVAAASTFGPYHLVMAAGGESLLHYPLRFLRTGGTCVLYQMGEAQMAVIDEHAFVERVARLQSVMLFDEVRREPASEALQRLLDLVVTNSLQPHVEVEAAWTEVGRLSRHLLGGSCVGKAVLHL